MTSQNPPDPHIHTKSISPTMDPAMVPATADPHASLIDDFTVAAASRSASPIAAAAPRWVPHPYLEEDLIPIVQRAIDLIPPSHLLPPSKNETFDTPDDAWTRLQDYAFSQGFAIVTGQCGKADPRKAYKCIHHSAETKNWRKLPEHKGEEDPEHGTIRLQERTKIKAKGCEWRVTIAYKDLKRGGSNRTWVLSLGKQEHSHGGRPKGIKNIAPTSSAAPPSSSAPPVLTKFKSGRQIKERKAWEQEKGLSQKRSRGLTLDATLQPAMQPNKKKSKQNLVPSEDIDERESQQQRILEAAYLLGEPPGSEK